MTTTRIIAASLCAMACAAPSQASQIDLYGDLGLNNWTGALFSPINTSTTTPFSQIVPGFGNVAGDVIATNTLGLTFSLVITNLTYNALIVNPPNGLMDIILVVTHNYQPASSGTYNGSHSLNGTWSTASLNAVQLDTIQDFGNTNVSLPSLFDLNTLNTSTFSLGPAGAFVTTASPVYTIQSILRLRIDGIGTITLPSSADVSATFVPGPGASALLGLAGLMGVRRRRAG